MTATPPTALAGLARALIAAGKLPVATAEDIARKAQVGNTSFVAQLIASGTVQAADLAHHIATIFAMPLLDLEAVDVNHLPKDVLDPKLCASYKVLPLAKRGNRLIMATADPTNKEAAEKIKFTTQLGVDWLIVEYDKLLRLVEQLTKSTAQALDSFSSDADFQLDDVKDAVENNENEADGSDVEDAPIVKFLHKMLIDAFKRGLQPRTRPGFEASRPKG